VRRVSTDLRCWVQTGISTKRWRRWPQRGRWRQTACWGCPLRWPASTRSAAVCARLPGNQTACTPSSGTHIPVSSILLHPRHGTVSRTAASCRTTPPHSHQLADSELERQKYENGKLGVIKPENLIKAPTAYRCAAVKGQTSRYRRRSKCYLSFQQLMVTFHWFQWTRILS